MCRTGHGYRTIANGLNRDRFSRDGNWSATHARLSVGTIRRFAKSRKQGDLFGTE
jgi:hypothetical protein